MQIKIYLVIVVSLFVQGVVFGIFASVVAERKGYSQGNWFLAGFFFSLVGVIAAAGLPMKGKSAETAHALTKQCPRCGETIKLAARVCMFCGAEFRPQDIATQAEAIAETRDTETSVRAIAVLLKQQEYGVEIDVGTMRSKLTTIMKMEENTPVGVEARSLLEQLCSDAEAGD